MPGVKIFPFLWYAKGAEEAARQARGWLIERFGVRWQIVPAMFEGVPVVR